jgi:peptide deformylase
MIIKQVTQIGNPVIRAIAKPVPAKNIKSVATKKIVRDLIDSMRHHNLVGMAAPQIGIGQRIFVTELRATSTRRTGERDGVRVFINPRITTFSKRKTAGGEGCGSVAYAGLFANVLRPHGVTVTAFNEKGIKFTLSATGLLAKVIQHETDHLNGKVFLDRLPNMVGLMSREEYTKQL